MLFESSRYLGISVGFGVIPFTTKNTLGTTAGDLQTGRAVSYSGGVYSGCGTNFDHFYLGAEFGAIYDFLNRTTTVTISKAGSNHATQLTIKRPITVGLDLVPGYITSDRDLLFYGRLGLGASWVNMDFSGVTYSISDNHHEVGLGLRAGFGIEYFMSDNFGLRIEYIYSRHGSIEGGCVKGGNAYSYHLDATKTHQVNLGLSIHF